MKTKQTTLTIADNGTASGAVNIGHWPVYAIHVSAPFVAADLGFQLLAPDGATWLDIYTSAGAKKKVVIGALTDTGRIVLADWDDDIGISGIIKVTSIDQSSGAAVTQTDPVTVTLYQRGHV